MLESLLSEYRGIDSEALASNNGRVEMVRVTMAICGGLVAGICRLQGSQGFLAFVLTQTATSLAIYAFNMRGNVDKFANTHLTSFLFSTMGNHILSFLLFWTLSHALVNIY